MNDEQKKLIASVVAQATEDLVLRHLTEWEDVDLERETPMGRVMHPCGLGIMVMPHIVMEWVVNQIQEHVGSIRSEPYSFMAEEPRDPWDKSQN